MCHNGSADAGEPLTCTQVWAYEIVLQHVAVDAPAADRPRLNCMFANAARWYALVQPAFCVVANDKSYPELVTTAWENGVFDNQMEDGANAGATWSIWFRRYGPAGGGTDDAVSVPHTE